MVTDQSARFGFRPDIEGLRAVAVVAVVGFHYDFGLNSGFVGVDIFFVISGYLISGLLLAELKETGSIALGAFYGRRARRLLPAALLVSVVTYIASAIIVSPLEQRSLAKAVAATSLYVSNLLFLKGFGYFAPESSLNPYLHTWSLSVEEQFYLVWPGLLLLSWRLGRSWLSPAKVLTALTILSLGLCIWLTRYKEPWAFYALPARAWEFGIGALACLAPKNLLGSRAEAVLGWGALVGLFLSCMVGYDPAHFPGPDATFSAVATASVLIFGASKRGPRVLLNSSPLQWLGARSYSIYLWHWPIIVSALALMPDPTFLIRVGLLVLTLGCAALSYRLIENPIRRSKWLIQYPKRSLALGMSLTMCGVAFAGCAGLSALYFAGSPQQKLIDQATAPHSVASDSASNCLVDFTDSKPIACTFGKAEASRTVVLFGDSHADEWSTPLAELASHEGWRLVTYLKSSCAVSEIPVYNMRLHRFSPECAEWRSKAIEAIVGMHADAIIVAQFSSGYILGPRSGLGERAVDLNSWSRGLQHSLNALAASGAFLFVLRDSPTPWTNVRDCLARAAWHNRPSSECDTPRAGALDETVRMAEMRAVRAIGAQYIDLSTSFCDANECPSIRDGSIVYRDVNHLTMAFAARQYEPLRSALLPFLQH